MGCDIHAYAEVRKDGKWEKVGDVFPLDEFQRGYRKKSHGDEFYDNRNYGVFGFLAGVRNYSGVSPLGPPRGFPADASPWVDAKFEEQGGDAHTPSHLSAAELLTFDYDAQMVDRRITRQIGPRLWDGGATATPEEEHLTTKQSWREFLGDHFFAHLDVLRTLGAPDDVRIVFWFDN